MFSQVKQRDLKGNEEREKHLLKDQGEASPVLFIEIRSSLECKSTKCFRSRDLLIVFKFFLNLVI